jgi:hypothetical protein
VLSFASASLSLASKFYRNGRHQAAAILIKDINVMGQSLKDGDGEAFRSKDLSPFIER